MKVVLISFGALFNINEGETVWVQNKASNSVWTCCHLEGVAARMYSQHSSALQPLLSSWSVHLIHCLGILLNIIYIADTA